jgi:iron complex outermembrane receptor protein
MQTRTLSALWPLLPALILPLPAAAQVEEIVVTAQKREQRLQDVPVTVTALTGETLKRSGITDLTDIADVTPGLSLESIGLRSPFIFMRGAGTGAFDIGSDPSVGVFVDEVYRPRFTGLQMDLVDIERIEIMKGPQVALFGRNTLGGAIHVITQKPTEEFTGTGSLDFGNRDYISFRGSASGALIPGTLLGRISVAHKSRDGFVENELTGVDHHDVNAQAVRGQLLWRAGRAQLRVSLDYARDDANAAPFSNETGNVLLMSPFSPLFPVVPSTFDKQHQRFNTDGYQEREEWGVTARLDLDLGRMELSSITGYLDHAFEELHDFDATEAQVIDRFADETSESISQELRLASTPGSEWFGFDNLEWLVGLYYFHDDAWRYERFTFGPDNLLSAVFNGGMTVLTHDFHSVDTEAWAAFAQAGLELTESLKLTLGVRYSEDRKTSDRDAAPTAFTPFLVGPYTVQLERKWDSLDPQVSLQYTHSDDLMFYASYAEGFKSGGFQPSVPADPGAAMEVFDPEHVKSYELGMKSSWADRRLTLNVAGFRAEYDNLQFVAATGVRQGGAPIVVITNAASSVTNGVEVELFAKPLENLQIGFGYAYLDAEFDDYVDGNGTDQSGHRIERSPKHQGNLNALYSVPLPLGTLSLYGEMKIQSRVFFDPDNIIHEEGYTTYNARVSLDSVNGHWQVSLWGRNLSNDDHCANIISLTASTIGLCSLDAMRTYGANVTYRW